MFLGISPVNRILLKMVTSGFRIYGDKSFSMNDGNSLGEVLVNFILLIALGMSISSILNGFMGK